MIQPHGDKRVPIVKPEDNLCTCSTRDIRSSYGQALRLRGRARDGFVVLAQSAFKYTACNKRTLVEVRRTRHRTLFDFSPTHTLAETFAENEEAAFLRGSGASELKRAIVVGPATALKKLSFIDLPLHQASPIPASTRVHTASSLVPFPFANLRPPSTFFIHRA